MKAWHIAALLLGVVAVLAFLKSQAAAGTKNLSQGATTNDVIFGLSKFGTGLLDLGGKIFTPSAMSDPYKDIREESADDYIRRLDSGAGDI